MRCKGLLLHLPCLTPGGILPYAIICGDPVRSTVAHKQAPIHPQSAIIPTFPKRLIFDGGDGIIHVVHFIIRAIIDG
jgi:hypothetical protein